MSLLRAKMESDRTIAGHRPWHTALFGMIVLTLGMGIGRFLYTPLLPVMLHEEMFTLAQLSLIASANYAGYLVGSLLFSWGLLSRARNLRVMLLAAALLTGVLILLMAMIAQPALVLLIRFMAGVASAGMMIFGSMLVLQHSRQPFVIASLFAGVGAGIVIGNEYVIVGEAYGVNATQLWLGAAFLSALLFVALMILLPKPQHRLPLETISAQSVATIQWWHLALLYGLAGFGYIIVATYLPLMARDAGNDALADHIWSIVGLAIIPGCYGWLWAARRWNILVCLCVNLVVQAGCVALISFIHSPWLLTLSGIGFGATFMGTSSLVMPLAKKIPAPRSINLLGLVTLTYGIGQIAGPLLVSAMQRHPHGMSYSIWCGALALCLAAGVSYRQYRQRECVAQ